MLFVFDTNALVSAILKTEGNPFLALRTAQQIETLIFSAETQSELRSVVLRSTFDKYIPPDERAKKTEVIISQAKLVETKTIDAIECRDATNIKFLRLAWEGQARCIVSGDADLKALHPFRGVPILSISEFNNIFTAP